MNEYREHLHGLDPVGLQLEHIRLFDRTERISDLDLDPERVRELRNMTISDLAASDSERLVEIADQRSRVRLYDRQLEARKNSQVRPIILRCYRELIQKSCVSDYFKKLLYSDFGLFQVQDDFADETRQKASFIDIDDRDHIGSGGIFTLKGAFVEETLAMVRCLDMRHIHPELWQASYTATYCKSKAI